MLPLPRFEIRRSKIGRRRWRFVLIDTNGEITLCSEHYNSRASALIGITAVKEAAPHAEVIDLS